MPAQPEPACPPLLHYLPQRNPQSSWATLIPSSNTPWVTPGHPGDSAQVQPGTPSLTTCQQLLCAHGAVPLRCSQVPPAHTRKTHTHTHAQYYPTASSHAPPHFPGLENLLHHTQTLPINHSSPCLGAGVLLLPNPELSRSSTNRGGKEGQRGKKVLSP